MARPGGWPRTAIGTFQRNRPLWAVVRTRTPATVSALPVIIRFFRSHGYRFVRV
jgi:hypothetical protein